MGSIDVTQQKPKKQLPPFVHSSKSRIQTEKNVDESESLLEELGVNSQQFKILFNTLPYGIAVYKMVYDQKGTPIDYILLESNKVYERIHHFERERIGKRAAEFNLQKQDIPTDWIAVYGRVASNSVPELFETYCEIENKWYQTYIYSPKKTFFVLVFMDIS